VNFPDVFEVQFTAQMEDELDKVEEGHLPWTQALQDFYDPFQKNLEKAKEEMQDMKGKGVPTDLKCDKCGAPMVIKLGRHGQFLACSNYPDCKNTKEFQRKETGEIQAVEEKPVEETCDKCGAPMIIKTGRFGKFLACSNYPTCKTTRRIGAAGKEKGEKAEPQLTGETCEKCGAPLVYRKGRFGPFIACSTFPKCRFTKKVTGAKTSEPGAEDQPPAVPKKSARRQTKSKKESS